MQADERQVRLVSGQPQTGHLATPAQWVFYTLAVSGDEVEELRVSVQARSGDPDVFVRACPHLPPPPPSAGTPARPAECPLPFKGQSDGWQSTLSGSDEVRIAPDRPEW